MVARPQSLDKAKGETYDMYDALSSRNIDCKLTPTCDFNDIKGSDVVLITAGIHRSPGMSRLDLAVPNAKIVDYYSRQIAEYAPDSIILVATNPVDVMTTVALKASGFNKMKVIGVGNHLDSLRLKNYFSRMVNINGSEVHTRVVGEHGENMVPLLSSTTIGGIPLKYFVEYVDMDVISLLQQLRNAGKTIISKKGATEYGPAFAISNIISKIITDTHKVLTVSCYLDGEVEGVEGVSLGVPAVISKNGIAVIVPIHMSDYEKKSFIKAAETIRETTKHVNETLNI